MRCRSLLSIIKDLSHISSSILHPAAHSDELGESPWLAYHASRSFSATLIGSLHFQVPPIVPARHDNVPHPK